MPRPDTLLSRPRPPMPPRISPSPTTPSTPAVSPARRAAERSAEGVQLRHQGACSVRDHGACTCTPAYQAQVWSARDQKPIRRSFTTLKDAKTWRQEAQIALRRGRLRAPSNHTLREAASDWITAARAGVVRTRSGHRYKPSTIRTYQRALHAHILPRLGHLRLTAITRHHIQEIADDLVARGPHPAPSETRSSPSRAIYRREHHRDTVATNPTRRLLLPASRTTRDRIAPPAEATTLITALPPETKPSGPPLSTPACAAANSKPSAGATSTSPTTSSTSTEAGTASKAPSNQKATPAHRRIPLTQTLRRYLITHRLHHPHTRRPPRIRKPGTTHSTHHQLRRARKTWHRRPHPHPPARMPPHLRRLHDRRRHQPQSPPNLHGPRLHHHHPRPLRPPPPRKRNPRRTPSSTPTSHPPKRPIRTALGWKSASRRSERAANTLFWGLLAAGWDSNPRTRSHPVSGCQDRCECIGRCRR